jgi:CRISPR-associated protein Cas2
VHVILVYDTASERNAAVLRTCRQFLHHAQRSVFEGQVSPAQLRRLHAALNHHIDPNYDHVIVYTFPPGAVPARHAWGIPDTGPTEIL